MSHKELPSNIVPAEYFAQRRLFGDLYKMQKALTPRSKIGYLGRSLGKVKAQDILNKKGRKTVIEFPSADSGF